MAKITEYTVDSRFKSTDVLLKDGSDGTKKIFASDAAISLAGLISSVNHRNVYRGKYLGTVVSDTQKAAIQAGTFDDLFIGDYWTINNVNYVIADMDYWYNCGDVAFTKHHLVIVPSTYLYLANMNDTNITTGGYVGSIMYTTNLSDAKSTINTAFGSMLLTHREYLTNAVTDGHPSGGAWFNSSVELMNEAMVYGTSIFSTRNNGITTPTLYTTSATQLALFRLNPRAHNTRNSYWLRDIVSTSFFACAYTIGGGYYSPASSTYIGVRPVFPIG